MSEPQTQFIKIENNVVYSNCIEYQNDEDMKIHLIPVLHIGEERYFKDIIEYIGDKWCQYEFFQANELEKHGISEVFSLNLEYERLFEIFKNDHFYKMNQKPLSKVLKKIDSEDLKEKMKLAKENSNINNTSQIVYDICNQVFFSMDSLSILQRYLAELLDLKFQYQVMDLKEMQKWGKWENLDLNVEIDPEFFKKPINVTDELINEWSKQVNVTLSTYITCLNFEREPDINMRKKNFVDEIVSIFTLKENIDLMAQQIPDFLFGLRNKIIDDFINSNKSGNEFAILYGAGHMYSIENTIEKLGFKPKSENLIKILSYRL